MIEEFDEKHKRNIEKIDGIYVSIDEYLTIMKNAWDYRLQTNRAPAINTWKNHFIECKTNLTAIGKVSYSIRKGTLVDDTFVCMVSLTMNIISANQKSLFKSFSCSANGNGTTEDQAKEYAIDKLLNKYISEYSSI